MKTDAEFEMLVHVYLAQRHATEALQWAGGPGTQSRVADQLTAIQTTCGSIIESASEENQNLALMRIL